MDRIIGRYTGRSFPTRLNVIDVSATAREGGVKLPIALTSRAWALCVTPSPAAARASVDEDSRLWEVLARVWDLLTERPQERRTGPIAFDVMCITTRARPVRVHLIAVCGPGDEAPLEVTVKLADEP